MQGNPIEESGELDVIKKILKEGGETVTIIDVGANKGQYSSHIMANVPSNKKVSFVKGAFNTSTLFNCAYTLNIPKVGSQIKILSCLGSQKQRISKSINSSLPFPIAT